MFPEKEKQYVRDLAKQYMEVANDPVQEERRTLWADHFSLKTSRTPVLINFGMHNVWCREVFSDDVMVCQDPTCRNHERFFRMMLFQADTGCDVVLNPWLTIGAARPGGWGGLWGVEQGRHCSDMEGGSFQIDPPIKDWSDMEKLSVTPHKVDEEQTRQNLERTRELFGEVIPIDVERGPRYRGFMADISTDIVRLRGLEQVMIDMYESPEQLHRLLAFMRDGILQSHQDAEDAGDLSLSCHQNQTMPYSHDLEWPAPNSGPRRRRDLWGFCAAQEYTGVSPEFHDEFLFQYQMEIYKHFGLVHYGCCEDLTRKIDMLRPLKNLRSIAVTPCADVAKCAAQIGTDYAISWRPNPTDMVCAGWDEARIRKIIRDGMEAMRGQNVHISLKDVETVQGDPERLKRWTKIVRSIVDEYV